ncbi:MULTISPECIES: M20/M25/M40 family metallo-hydrolase [unclassified Sphingomonas]|uniref:M20/M25/M40 family metallo-hydrolase n=1 Tax=unclassified Sphingomonas TaxID=196159 RepID=UPI001D11F2B6|nr:MULTISPECIES: M20/M25/M40 family metallo-hydrolase [unclassified Sphingomonas]MCC2980565.1 M20/M25/M40 family metallo-hydrolase [Sphingomonas sp. IC4-52]MCD2316326.1 M20/M25/M40 family metallo-hydrolase [Sphingomonas sp. IC-11]
MRGYWRTTATALAGLSLAPSATAQNRPDEKAFFDLYKELVETNTVVDQGSCTRAARQIANRMKAAGYSDSDLVIFSTPEHPEDGGLVATLPGSDPKAGAMLLLGHLDVVAAKREDWQRDPFKLVEEDGFYYARGSVDDKSMSSIWADTMIRFRQQNFRPKRTVKMALTCGEETTYAFNGADWLARNRPELVRADFVLNEGGGGRLDARGQRQALAIQVGEKAAQNFTFVATNPGGHSSAPTPENAIYDLADAIKRVQNYEFPIRFSDTTRAFFTANAKALPSPTSAAIQRLLANPKDQSADEIVSRDKVLHSTLRTTCVATLVNAGHAENALPQRATANVNCRIFPGETVDGTLAKLKELAGPKVTVTANLPVRPVAVPPPLDPKIMGPVQSLAAKHFPGVPVVPMMSTGATDGVFFGTLNMPVYGVPGLFLEPDLNGTHGLNERIRVTSLYEGRAYLFDLAKTLAE